MSNSKPISPVETGILLSRAKRVLAYGGLDGVVNRPLFNGEGGTFPHFAIAADGCRLVDSTGQTYIDWINGWGPGLLGYRNPTVEQAINEQLLGGPLLSLMHPIEVELAELITEMVPSAEMVAFGKNGSDAVTAAIRIARAVTGRDIILQCGFHGFHDWYACQHPGVRGILPILKNYVEPFPYNNIHELGALFRKHRERVAAVVMEPVNMWMPENGYLENVRELCNKHGALLVFDEMVTGFRLARGGAQEFFGVTPDLTCLGKAMGNGMPLSAICGRANYMQVLPSCGFGMTFRGETLSLAAALATLRIVQSEPVVEHLAETGRTIRAGFQSLCEKFGIRCELSGPDPRMTFVFYDQGGMSWNDLRDLFLQECLKRGVLTNGNLLPSYAHDQSAIDETLASLEGALSVVKLAVSGETVSPALPVGGFPFMPRALLASGFVDFVQESPAGLNIGGWILVGSEVAERIELSSGSGQVVIGERVNRPDLKQAFRNCEQAEHAGWQARLPRENFLEGETYKFMMSAMRSAKPTFQCCVNIQSGLKQKGPWSISDGVLYV